MNMIPRHASNLSSVEQTSDILLIAGSTPASEWGRMLPLLERAGCTLPAEALLEDWYTVARGNAALGQPGVATLNPGVLRQSLRSASSALLDTCLPPVLLVVESLDARPEFWLKELPGARLLMFHTRPETALVAAMQADESLNDALEKWRAAAEGLLHTFRHHRRRIALIDVECALAAPIDFLRCCKTRLGLQPLPYSTAPVVLAHTGEDIQRLVAAQMVAQQPRLAELIAELEACSLPLGEPAAAPYVDCNKVYIEQHTAQAQLRELEDQRTEQRRRMLESESRLAEVRAAHELALLQLHQAQDALESKLSEEPQSERVEEYQRKEAQLQADIRALVAERDAQARRIEEISRVLDERSKQVAEFMEKATILTNERDIQARRIDELARNLGERSKQVTEFMERSKALADANQTQAKLIHEHLEKLNAHEAARREVAAENELLQLQLHQAQEELESYYQSFKSVARKLTEAERNLLICEKRLRNIEKSTSWRLTAPLRNVVKRFRAIKAGGRAVR